jgi:hypothetical protein
VANHTTGGAGGGVGGELCFSLNFIGLRTGRVRRWDWRSQCRGIYIPFSFVP